MNLSIAVVNIEQSDFSDSVTYVADIKTSKRRGYHLQTDRALVAPVARQSDPKGTDDPQIVSDGDALWSSHAVTNMLRELYHARHESTGEHTGSTAIETLVGRRSSWRFPELASWSKVLAASGSKTHAIALETMISTARSVERWSAFASYSSDQITLISGPNRSLETIASSYHLLMQEMLRGRAVSFDPPYADVLGAFVLDYVLDTQRISVILHNDVVQVMTHLNEEFGSQTFRGLEKSKLDVLEYVLDRLP